MNICTLHLSPAQADVFYKLIVNTPWFRKQAKACTISTSTKKNTLTFDLDYDADDIIDMISVATRFGYPRRTVTALECRIEVAVEHAKALRRAKEAA